MKLNREEKELLASVERGEWRSVEDFHKEAKRHREYARQTLRKDRRINIRLSHLDLEELQAKAVHEGIPYQTFIASILHRYASGQWVKV